MDIQRWQGWIKTNPRHTLQGLAFLENEMCEDLVLDGFLLRFPSSKDSSGAQAGLQLLLRPGSRCTLLPKNLTADPRAATEGWGTLYQKSESATSRNLRFSLYRSGSCVFSARVQWSSPGSTGSCSRHPLSDLPETERRSR